MIRYRQGMNIKKQQNETWRIAPKFDWKNLRENYMNGNIFRVGDIVENDNTGLIGEDYSYRCKLYYCSD